MVWNSKVVKRKNPITRTVLGSYDFTNDTHVVDKHYAHVLIHIVSKSHEWRKLTEGLICCAI